MVICCSKFYSFHKYNFKLRSTRNGGGRGVVVLVMTGALNWR